MILIILQDIFTLIITIILPSLGDLSHAYHQQHLYVLSSLAEVQSIVLLTDLPGSEQLITLLFTSFFDMLAASSNSSMSEQLGKKVELHMTQILTIMIEESENLPPEVVDVIVAQFLRTDPRALHGTGVKGKKGSQENVDERQSTLTLKELPPSYNMAKTLCNTCADKMTRYISQYFNDVVVDASSASKASNKKLSSRRISEDIGLEDLEFDTGPTEDDLRELQKVHQLLRELWRACPAVLQNVVPQLEAELSAENVQLRLLATETFGDMASGIGSAGPPPPPPMDPTAYPPLSLSDGTENLQSQDILTKPSSPQPFSQAHPHAYGSFLSRCHDRSTLIRAGWVTAIGRILTTSAGGVGLNPQEEEKLITGLTRILGDADEKVRVSAVKTIGTFSLRDIIYKLGSPRGMESSGSILAVLAERVRDRRHSVRKEAMTVLARLWGAASGEMIAGNEQVLSTLGVIPSKILDTYYANDLDIHALLDHVLFEDLLPLKFPPIKDKEKRLANGTSRKGKDHLDQQVVSSDIGESLDPDRIRVERILLLVKGLDERAKKVFFAVQSRQLKLAQVMKAYLQRCEDYNGGVMDSNEVEIRHHLKRLIDNLVRGLPDSTRVQDNLWKFAKMHDRRSYQLIRYCMAAESEYRTVTNAIKEFRKRLSDSFGANHDVLDSMTLLLYRTSALIYNKSHVPAIMEFSRSGDKALAAVAHELLREISTQTPEVLKAQVKTICNTLQQEAPSPSPQTSNSPTSINNLKACASFAAKFPKEIPKERTFIQAMKAYALYGHPAEAAKYAVSILMTASDKKELLANDLLKECIKNFQYGKDNFLSRLATLSRLMLLAPEQMNEEADAISDIAIEQILLQVRKSSSSSAEEEEWSVEADIEVEAKSWALKILVNRIRSFLDPETLSETAAPVYKLLFLLITQSGEIAPKKNTPPAQRSRLRLLAARLCLKLCVKRPTDALLSADFFNSLALVTQDPLLPIRSSFLQRLKKYLGHQKLPQRFFTIPFLLAFEPSQSLKSDTITWIRSRAHQFALIRSQQASPRPPPVMESVLARLISLLAHHPDYGTSAEELVDFARYITFYLQTVATEENLSFLYQIAQRVKQCRDALSNSKTFDDNLYHLSDLAQLTIRKFEDAHGWSIQTLPGKISLPRSLYSEVRDHAEGLGIAEHNYLPDNVEEGVETLVKQSLRATRHTANTSKKRRSDVNHHDNSERGAKKAKSLPIRRSATVTGDDSTFSSTKKSKAKASSKRQIATSKKGKRQNSVESETTAATAEQANRRRSGRVQSNARGKYAERDDAEDDQEMGEGVAEWRYENEDGEEVEQEEEVESDNGGESEISDDQGDEKIDERDEDDANDDDSADGNSNGQADEDKAVPPSSSPVISASKSPSTATKRTSNRASKKVITKTAKNGDPISSSSVVGSGSSGSRRGRSGATGKSKAR